MIWHRGYQKVDNLMGTVHTKIKGSATDSDNLDALLAVKSWDATDLVWYFNDGFFMPTKFEMTKQSQGKCSIVAKSHLKKLKGAWTEKCSKDGGQCRTGVHTFTGVQTGTCITEASVDAGGGGNLIGVCRSGTLQGARCYG